MGLEYVDREATLALKDQILLLKMSRGEMNTFNCTKQVEEWNEWRNQNRHIRPCLDNVDLSGLNLSHANFREVSLKGANFSYCRLVETDFVRSDLTGSKFNEAYLYGALLDQADLSNADLRNSTLWWVTLIETILRGANISGSAVYGVSPWNVDLEGATQNDLIISRHDEAILTVDDLEVAHFMYLLINNKKLSKVINIATSKVVLILGRFEPKRKVVLDALREELRKCDYLPVIFDFDKPTDRDFTETVMTLAGLSKFIIADLTQPKSSPLESHATITAYMVPFIPIIQEGDWPFAMFVDLQRKHHWVEKTLQYKDKDDLLQYLDKIIARAEAKYKEIQLEKAKQANKPVSGEEW